MVAKSESAAVSVSGWKGQQKHTEGKTERAKYSHCLYISISPHFPACRGLTLPWIPPQSGLWVSQAFSKHGKSLFECVFNFTTQADKSHVCSYRSTHYHPPVIHSYHRYQKSYLEFLQNMFRTMLEICFLRAWLPADVRKRLWLLTIAVNFNFHFAEILLHMWHLVTDTYQPLLGGTQWAFACVVRQSAK